MFWLGEEGGVEEALNGCSVALLDSKRGKKRQKSLCCLLALNPDFTLKVQRGCGWNKAERSSLRLSPTTSAPAWAL